MSHNFFNWLSQFKCRLLKSHFSISSKSIPLIIVIVFISVCSFSAQAQTYSWGNQQHTDSDGNYQITYSGSANNTSLYEAVNSNSPVLIEKPITTGVHTTTLSAKPNGTYKYHTSTRVCRSGGGAPGEPRPPVCTYQTSLGPTITVSSPVPSVSLVSPASNIGLHIDTTYMLEASASVATGAILEVEFKVNGVVVATDNSAPYQHSWTPSVGSYTIIATAKDSNGDVSVSSARTVTVTVNSPPSVALSAPLHNSSGYNNSNIIVSANASDSDGSVSLVEFYANGVNIGSDVSSPFQIQWTPSVYQDYQLKAVATDDDGKKTTSSQILFHVESTPPVLAIQSPAQNSTVPGNTLVDFMATASDSDGSIASLEFRVNNTLLGVDTSTPYGFPWTPRATGTFTLAVIAKDNAGATSTLSRTVTVNSLWGQNLASGTLSAASFKIYYGNLDGVEKKDIYFHSQSGGLSFVVYHNGAQYLAPLPLTMTNAQLSTLTPAQATDVFFADFSGDGINDVLVRGAISSAPAFILKGHASATLPQLLVEYSGSNQLPYHNFSDRSLTIEIQDLNFDNRADVFLPGGGTYGDDVGYVADAQGIPRIGQVAGALDWVANTPVNVDDAPITTTSVQHDETVGSIVGSGGVDGGQANYRLALVVPPGRNGMQPELAISYSSRGGSGVLGMGWSLSVGSSIDRCAKTVTHDGRAEPVSFSVSDRLCLDGQRLIPISGSYGVSGTTYSPEMDVTTRITQSGSLDSTSTWFRVERKSGKVAYFGKSNDSRHSPHGLSATLSWAISHEQDRSGNAIEYRYSSFDKGEHLLTDIYYTGQSDASGNIIATGNRRVGLSYEWRDDISSRYTNGGLSRQTQRLKTISTYYGSEKLREYRIGYQQSDTSSRSLLSNVQLCYDNQRCKPATQMTWLHSEPTFTVEKIGYRNTTSNSGDEGGTLVAQLQSEHWINQVLPRGDFNGDGAPDWPTWFMDAEGVYRGENSYAYQDCSHNSYTFQFQCVKADFNLDGRTDSWRIVNQVIQIGYTPESGGAPTWVNTSIALPSSGFQDGPMSVADYNADGWPDLVVVLNSSTSGNASPKSLSLWLHTGNTAAPYTGNGQTIYTYGEQNVGGATTITTTSSQMVGDVDGNGIPDMIHADLDLPISAGGFNPSQQPVPRTLYLGKVAANGTVYFEQKDLSSHALGLQFNTSGSDEYYFNYFMDVNGDGLTDWISWLGTDSSLWLSLSKGSGNFAAWQRLGGASQLATRRLAYVADPSTPADINFVYYPKFAHAFHQFDYDSDGRAELLIPTERLTSTCITVTKLNGSGTAYTEDLCGEDIYSYYYWKPGAAPRHLSLKGVDFNLYRYGALRFEEQSDGSFSVVGKPTGIIGSSNRSAAVDAYGNGLNDFIFNYGCEMDGCTVSDASGPMAGKSHGMYISRNRGSATGNERYQPSDMLAEVIDGIGVQNQWTYRPLSSRDSRFHSETRPFYEPDFAYLETLGNKAKQDHFHFTSSMYVVAEHQQSNGVGGVNHTQYRYKGAMAHRNGRGFQGFRTVIAEQLDAGLQIRSDFHQVFPLAGKLYHTGTWALDDLASDSANDEPISEERYQWRFWPLSNKGSSYDTSVDNVADQWQLKPGSSYFVGLEQQKSIQHKLQLTGSSRAELFSTQKQFDYDEYGNITTAHSTYEEPQSQHRVSSVATTVYDYTYTNGWWLNKPLSTTTVHNAVASRQGVAIESNTDATKTITTTYPQWNLVARLPESVLVTPSTGLAVTTLFNYNSHGLPSSVTQSAAGETNRTTQTFYSGDGYFVDKTINPKNHTSEQLVNPRFGAPDWTIDINGHIAYYAYDVFGYPTTLSVSGMPDRKNGLQWCSASCPEFAVFVERVVQAGTPAQTEYRDQLGRAIRTEVEAFDSGDVVVQAVSFDALGQVTFESSPAVDGVSDKGTRYIGYDALARPITKVVDQTDNQQLEVTYTYEQGDRGFTTDIDANGVPLSRTYNGLNQLVETEDGEGGITRYAYDGMGNPIVMQDARIQRITATYNALGQKQWVKDPNMGRKDFTYTGFGQVKTETDAKGDVTTYIYDTLARLTQRNLNGQPEAKWYFDTAAHGLGALAKEERVDQTHSKTYSYDSLSRPNQVATLIDSESFTVQMQYDQYYGRLKALRYPTGLTLAYGFNERGYQTRVSNAASGYVYREITAMSAFGQWETATLAAGAAYAHRSDDEATGQLRNVSLDNLIGNLHHQTYQYDDVGNIEHIETTLPSSSPSANLETLVYDDLQRLTKSMRSQGPTIDYDYDAVGNITRKSDFGQLYHYTGTRPNAVNKIDVVGGGSISYGYDNNGNRTHENGVQSIWYNATNMPTKIIRSGKQLHFNYDASHQRYKQIDVSANRTTLYVDKLFEKTTAGSDVHYRYFIEDIAVLTSTVSSGLHTHEIAFTHRDRLGSATVLFDHLGQIRETHSFDPFGKPRTGVAKDKLLPILASDWTTRGFTDHEHLDDVQLIHMNGRVYDYNTGRFLSVDPVIQAPGNSQSLNPYSYIMNNPLGGTDPSGYSAEDNDKLTFTAESSMVKTGSRIPETVKSSVTFHSNGAMTGQVNGVTLYEGKWADGSKINDVSDRGNVGGGTSGEKTENPFSKLPKGVNVASTKSAGLGGVLRALGVGVAATNSESLDPTTTSLDPTISGSSGGGLGDPCGSSPEFCSSGESDLFGNQLPHQLQVEIREANSVGVRPVNAGSSEFAKVANEGTIKWIVTADGELLVAPQVRNGVEISHAFIARGAPVRAAGQANIAVGGGETFGINISSHSGHYLNGANAATNARVIQIGKEAFSKYGIKFPY